MSMGATAEKRNPAPEHMVLRCLRVECKHVFVADYNGPKVKCPECKERAVGSVWKGDVCRWSLKQARVIAATMRGI